MKIDTKMDTKNVLATIAVLLLALIASNLLNTVSAQTSSPGVITILGVASSPSACAWPAGASVTNGMALCPTSSGLYYALNGSATFLPVSPSVQATGVTSFNGRTGAITLTKADVTGTGISVSSTATTTVNSTVQ